MKHGGLSTETKTMQFSTVPFKYMKIQEKGTYCLMQIHINPKLAEETCGYQIQEQEVHRNRNPETYNTFEYPKSHIFNRGAGLPSNNVFSSFKSR